MEKSILFAKLRVTGVSLAVWALAAIVLLACTRLFWYQDFLFMHDGGFGGLSLIIPIDLVLGPCLMFVAYNPTKPARTRVIDVAVVIAIQIAAFAYGLYQIYQQHPVLLTYSDGAFSPVRGEMLDRQKTSASLFAPLSTHQPPFLFVKPPSKEYMPRMLNLTLNLGVSMNSQVDLLDPLAPHKKDLFANDGVLRSYLQKNLPAQYQELQQTYPAGNNKLAWFNGRYSGAILVFDNNANYLGSLDVPVTLENPAASVSTPKVAAPAASGGASAGPAAASAPSAPAQS